MIKRKFILSLMLAALLVGVMTEVAAAAANGDTVPLTVPIDRRYPPPVASTQQKGIRTHSDLSNFFSITNQLPAYNKS